MSPQNRGAKGAQGGQPTVLGSSDGITKEKVVNRCNLYAFKQTDIEVISSASDSEIALPPKPAMTAPYTMEAGPQFNKKNRKVIATVSHEVWRMVSKGTDKGRLIDH